VHLEELYLAQNKLRQVQGVSRLTKLRTLDLGANRIRVCMVLASKRQAGSQSYFIIHIDSVSDSVFPIPYTIPFEKICE
jgi:hypothetical protein